MTAPDPKTDADRLATLPRIPRDEGGPVFAEPWQAQAFALAVKLSEAGYFTWKEWTSALAHDLTLITIDSDFTRVPGLSHQVVTLAQLRSL